MWRLAENRPKGQERRSVVSSSPEVKDPSLGAVSPEEAHQTPVPSPSALPAAAQAWQGLATSTNPAVACPQVALPEEGPRPLWPPHMAEKAGRAFRATVSA